jgi:hypothetical protein
MCLYDLAILRPDFLKIGGFWLAVIGLVGQGIIVFSMPRRISTERIVRLLLVGIAIVGIAANRMGDVALASFRHLAECQTQKVISAIKPYAGQLFQMVTYRSCEECSGTLIFIYDMLQQAGWVREGPPQGIPIGSMQGILISVSDGAAEPTKNAAHALHHALNDEGLIAKLNSDTAEASVVDIIVGLKP